MDHKGRVCLLGASELGAREDQSYIFTLPLGVPGLGPPPGRPQSHSCPCQLPRDLPSWSPWGDSTSHHISILVVCVVVPSSSSGARYLPTEAAYLTSGLPPRQLGPPRGTVGLHQPTHRPPAFLGAQDGLHRAANPAETNTGHTCGDSSCAQKRPCTADNTESAAGSPGRPFCRQGRLTHGRKQTSTSYPHHGPALPSENAGRCYTGGCAPCPSVSTATAHPDAAGPVPRASLCSFPRDRPAVRKLS